METIYVIECGNCFDKYREVEWGNFYSGDAYKNREDAVAEMIKDANQYVEDNDGDFKIEEQDEDWIRLSNGRAFAIRKCKLN